MSNFTMRYGTDKTLEEEGAWVELGDDIRVRIIRAKSARSRKVLRALQKPYENMTRSGRELPEEVSQKIAREWAASAIVLDWEGVTDEDGNPLAFSRESAIQVFDAFPDFLDEVVTFSQLAETFRNEVVAEKAKNSGRGSAGT